MEYKPESVLGDISHLKMALHKLKHSGALSFSLPSLNEAHTAHVHLNKSLPPGTFVISKM